MLNNLETRLKGDKKIKTIYLHVQEGNDEALNFYKNKGYVVESKIEDYYKNVKPTSAFLLQKAINQNPLEKDKDKEKDKDGKEKDKKK